MHTTVYEKVQNSARVYLPKDLQCQLDVPYLTLLMQWLVNKLPNYLLQQFPHCFILFWK